MMAKSELFWLGDGVITIGDKEYGEGQPLPVDKLDKDDLAKLKKDGRVGEKIAVVDVNNKALQVLQNKIAELESGGCDKCSESKKELKALTEQMGLLQEQVASESNRVAELGEEAETAGSKIDGLESQLAEAQEATSKAQATTKEVVDEVVDLKALVADLESHLADAKKKGKG